MTRIRPRLALALTAAALLGACSGGKFADLANLNDPRTVVDDTADGTKVTLRQGNALVVRLPFTPTDGYRWQLKEVPQLASPVRLDFAPATGPGNLPVQPPYSMVLSGLNTGGSVETTRWVPSDKLEPAIETGVAVFRLRAVATGDAPLQFEYRRSDDPAGAATKTVRIDVAVVPL